MLKGNKALVTGASRGIGYAIAKELVQNGCSVVITGRNEETLKKAAKEIGGSIYTMVWDAKEYELAEQKINEAAKIMGGLDILVNNAGIFAQRSEWNKEGLLSTTPDEWRAVMMTNVDAVFFAMQAAVNYMRKNKIQGNILNISSVAGYEPAKGAYGASKSAVCNMIRGWGKMFADEGITINGIAPGPVATEMNHWHEGDSLKHSAIPFGRFATIEELGKAALFMLDENSAMICGETLVFDGAYHIR